MSEESKIILRPKKLSSFFYVGLVVGIVAISMLAYSIINIVKKVNKLRDIATRGDKVTSDERELLQKNQIFTDADPFLLFFGFVGFGVGIIIMYYTYKSSGDYNLIKQQE